MKIILTLFILLFSSSVLADDISDFEIEGMSVGDSLLDYFSKKEILENQMDWFENDEFKESVFLPNNDSSEYDDISIMYKNNDEKFIIESIQGGIFYIDNIEKCYLKKNEIIERVSNLLTEVEWKNHNYEDEEGIFEFTYTRLKSGDVMHVACYDWHNKTEKDKNWSDHLRVVIQSKEYSYWITIENR